MLKYAYVYRTSTMPRAATAAVIAPAIEAHFVGQLSTYTARLGERGERGGHITSQECAVVKMGLHPKCVF